jgi:hypothetical protein
MIKELWFQTWSNGNICMSLCPSTNKVHAYYLKECRESIGELAGEPIKFIREEKEPPQ